MEETYSYWIGPHGIRVPNEIECVQASDGSNHLHKNGYQTELFSPYSPTKEDYLRKYAELRNDGYYWCKIKKDYWIGPYDIRVPNKIECIRASDGVNHLHKIGYQTELFNPYPPTKEEYLIKYAELRSDGYHWYGKRNHRSK